MFRKLNMLTVNIATQNLQVNKYLLEMLDLKSLCLANLFLNTFINMRLSYLYNYSI